MWLVRRHRIAAFQGDLAVGARPHGFASFGDDGVRRAMNRTVARPLQCRGTRGSRRFTSPQRRIGDDPEARAPGEAARSPSGAAARWRAVVEPQGRELDGRGTGARVGRAAARLGGLEGDRLVDPGAASEEPEISDAEEAAAFKKSSRTPSPRRQRSNPASQSRSSPRTSAASA